MDELGLLEATLPHAAGPSADAVAAGRHALLAELHRPAAAPVRRRRPRRLLATAAVAAALAVGITTAQVVGIGSLPGGPGATVANAAELGTLAAAAAEREPWVPPRADQWVYKRTRNAAGDFDMNRSWEGVDPAHSNDVSDWTRVDGRAVAYVGIDGRFVVHEDGDDELTRIGGPMFGVWNYHTLPTDREALLARIKTPYDGQVGPTTDGNVFSTIASMLQDPMPPALRSALFRLLPTLDGVVLRRDVADQAGRRGVAFELSSGDWREWIVVDPSSFAFLGYTVVATRDYRRQGDAGVTRAGTVVQSSAVVASRIVDHAGDTR
jgi:hypothetical protein